MLQGARFQLTIILPDDVQCSYYVVSEKCKIWWKLVHLIYDIQRENPTSKMSAITNATTEQLSEQCQCSYTGSHIVSSQLFCDNNKLIYQAKFLETSGKTLNEISTLIQKWVLSQPFISINSKPYELDSSCSVFVDAPGISTCALQSTTASTLIPQATLRPPSPLELAAVVGVGIILLLLAIVVIGLVTFFIRRSRKNLKYDVNW